MCYHCQKLFTNLWSKGIPCWLSKTSNILPFETETVAAHMFLLPPVIHFRLKKWSLAEYSLFMYQHQFVITVFNPVCMCHRAKQILPPPFPNTDFNIVSALPNIPNCKFGDDLNYLDSEHWNRFLNWVFKKIACSKVKQQTSNLEIAIKLSISIFFNRSDITPFPNSQQIVIILSWLILNIKND